MSRAAGWREAEEGRLTGVSSLVAARPTSPVEDRPQVARVCGSRCGAYASRKAHARAMAATSNSSAYGQ